MSTPKPVADRFWPKVDKTGGCWLWTGATRNGYGNMSMPPKGHEYTHRAAWQMANGPIPASLEVCHKCDVRLCVRVDHLFLGTRRDNARDMGAKGRAGATRHPETVTRGERWNATHPKPDHCKRGHPKTSENRNRFHQCIPCGREASLRNYYLQRERNR